MVILRIRTPLPTEPKRLYSRFIEYWDATIVPENGAERLSRCLSLNQPMGDHVLTRAREIVREEGPVRLFESSVRYTTRDLRKWGFRRLRVRRRYLRNKQRYDAVADPYKIIFIPAGRIREYFHEKPWGTTKDGYGRIEPGEWDHENTSPIGEMTKIRAITEHFTEGVSWENTGLIDWHLERLQQEGVNSIEGGCRTKADLLSYYDRIDELYADIERNGFELTHRRSLWDPRTYNVPIVSIGRDGSFIFERAGAHRTAIAIALDLDELPVSVAARHEQWQRIRDEFSRAESSADLSERARTHREHPDLGDIPT